MELRTLEIHQALHLVLRRAMHPKAHQLGSCECALRVAQAKARAASYVLGVVTLADDDASPISVVFPSLYPITAATATRCYLTTRGAHFPSGRLACAALRRSTDDARPPNYTSYDLSDFVCIWFGIIFLLSFFWKNNVGK